MHTIRNTQELINALNKEQYRFNDFQGIPIVRKLITDFLIERKETAARKFFEENKAYFKHYNRVYNILNAFFETTHDKAA